MPPDAAVRFIDDFQHGLVFDYDRWHAIQALDPAGRFMTTQDPHALPPGIELDVHDGVLVAQTPGGPHQTKAMLKKEELPPFPFHAGEDVWMAVTIIFPDSAPITDLFVMDLERTSDGVGHRLHANGLDEQYMFVNAKTSAGAGARPSVYIPIPRGRLVTYVWHLHLSPNEDGLVELWQDGVQTIRTEGPTLPPTGPQAYDRIEVGITANSSGRPQTVVITDVTITRTPIFE
jgi:hypothetical protein